MSLGIFQPASRVASPLGSMPGKAMRGVGLGSGANATPTASDAVNYPYGKYSAQTLQLQNVLNALLIKKGFCPLVADGKLGPKTCGAGLAIYDADPSSPDVMLIPTMQQNPAEFQPSTCNDSAPILKPTDPGGCGTGPVAPDLTPAEQAAQNAALTSSGVAPTSSFTGAKALGFIAGGAAAVALVYIVKRRSRSR